MSTGFALSEAGPQSDQVELKDYWEYRVLMAFQPSIGPGGIERVVPTTVVVATAVPQSDQVELKGHSDGLAAVRRLPLNRTRWN